MGALPEQIRELINNRQGKGFKLKDEAFTNPDGNGRQTFARFWP
jgi:hypothetical protein